MDNIEEMINALRDKLDESSRAKVSEELLAVIGVMRGQQEELTARQTTINHLTQENNELLKTNGKLFQKIGFDKPNEPSITLPEKEEKLLDINDVIDSRGNIIKR